MAFKHSTDQIKADAATAALGKCPECGAVVSPKDPAGHVVKHWPRYADLDPNTDAARRARLVLSIGQPRPGE
jgi:hypothetical protein